MVCVAIVWKSIFRHVYIQVKHTCRWWFYYNYQTVACQNIKWVENIFREERNQVYCEEYTCTFMKLFLVNNCLVSNYSSIVMNNLSMQ